MGKKEVFWHQVFYVTDLVGQNKVKIEDCPTDEMIADYMTKTLVGGKFKIFRDMIMNLSSKHHRIGHKGCVGWNIKGLIVNLVKWDKKSHSDG